MHTLGALPQGFDASKKYPLVSFIHGGAHLMSRDQWHVRWNYHSMTAPGYVLITANYTGSTGYGEVWGSMGGRLANWLQASTTRFKCLFSHAGLINLESQWGTSDSIYHREVNAGGPVWEQGKVWREQNPIRYAAKFKTPILPTVGENDYRVPLNQTLENWSVLQRLCIPSRLIVFPDENHWILKGENHRFFTQELQEWLAKHLGT